MAITDELREYAHDCCARVDDAIHAIADRIDAEHQKALDEWKAKHGQMWLKGYSECHAELLEGNETLASDLEKCGWIRLPNDADGEYIRIGDVMEFSRFDIDCPVTREVDGVGVGVFFAWCGERGYEQLDAGSYSHRKQPTVEAVLREMLDALGELPSNATNEAIIAEYASKLRLAGDGDE